MQERHTYTIGAFAKLTGTTERALRFYDRKGLLKPSGRNLQGHRYYREEDLLRLQQILTLKFLDFPLDEIGEHLSSPERDLAQTLELQHDMLLRKREQLDKVIGALDRMRVLLDGAGRIDSSLLLFFMHCFQNEEAQKRYMAERLPPSLVEAMFMEGLSYEERLEKERMMTIALIELSGYCREGRRPDDPDVLRSGRVLVGLLGELIGKELEGMSEEQMQKLKQTMGGLPGTGGAPGSVIFSNGFTEEEELFLVAVMDQLKAEGMQWTGGGEDYER